MIFDALKPAVDKKILIFLSGLMWSGVGIMLMSLACSWLMAFDMKILYISAGFIAAMPIHIYGFLRLADRNLERLHKMTGKKCVFSFMTWKSYLIVLLMVSMGIALRHSAIPKNYLAVLYSGIGLALFLSSIRYHRDFVRLILG